MTSRVGHSWQRRDRATRPSALSVLVLILLGPGERPGGRCGPAGSRGATGRAARSPRSETRKAAEEALIKLGPRVLPLLPEPSKAGEAEREKRLESRPRGAPRAAADKTNLGASKVTIQGQGAPALRGAPAAPGAVGQRHHRPPRAGGGRGDQPRARPGDRRQALLRGARPGRRARPRSRPTSTRATARSA